MKITRVKEHNLQQTLNEIERLVNLYYKDVSKFYKFSIYDMFNFISKKIEYKKDPENSELVMRPAITLKRKAGDCDDKTIIFLAWLKLKHIPCGYAIVSKYKDKPYHHIFPFCYNRESGIIIDLDATYDYNTIGTSKKWMQRKNFFII